MYVPKTQQNDDSVQSFLALHSEEERYPDLLELLDLMTTISKEPAKMWGTQIIGFGNYHYESKSSKGAWYKIGFSPRKQNISIYVVSGFDKEKKLMEQLGNYKTAKSCLYIKRLADIDKTTLAALLTRSIETMKEW